MYATPILSHAVEDAENDLLTVGSSPAPSQTAEDSGKRAARLSGQAGAVINGSLSGDSKAFIKSNVQTGGE